MQRFRTALLAAIAIGAGIPSIASAQMGDRGDQRGDRPDRGQSGQRPDGGQFGGGRQDRPRFQGEQQAQPQQQFQAPPQQQAQAQQGRPDQRGGFDRGDRQPGFGQQGQRSEQGRPGFADNRDDRRSGFDGRQGYAGRQGYDPRQGYDQRQAYGQRQGDPRQGFAGNGYRGGDQRFAYDRNPGFGAPQGRGGTNWRNDRRYDWQGYRNGHRDIFRAGRYQPPRGYGNYGYRSFQIGFRLDPFLYARNYWIADPYDYRLPPVGGSLRWVRYYDDVLLVDLRTGQIVDVIQQFFW